MYSPRWVLKIDQRERVLSEFRPVLNAPANSRVARLRAEIIVLDGDGDDAERGQYFLIMK